MLPARIARRTKQGFSAPDASWFRGESIDYLKRLLGDPDARIYQLLNPAYVRRILGEHTSGRVNHRLLIWSFLSLEWWARAYMEGSLGSADAAAATAVPAGRDVGAGAA
jgi:asparagine synthase (glutamine-hydrolysing)